MASFTQPHILCVTTVDLTAWCFLRTKLKALVDCGAKVTVACTVERFRDELEATGAEVIHLPISRRISPVEDFASLLDLTYLIKRLKPDIVHSFTSKAGFICRLAAKLCRVPIIIHSIYELPENAVRNPIVKGCYWALEFLAARLAHHFVTISQANYRQIIREHICRPQQLTLIREGLVLERYHSSVPATQIRSHYKIPENTTLIGTCGRLEPAKGHSDLLQAFKLVQQRYPQTHLLIVGKGCLQDQLQKQISQLGLEHSVTLAGWVENILDVIGAFDIYALASHIEGLGVANMEAMAMHKPVVCTGVGGVLDVMEDKVTGLLVPPHKPVAMAEAIMTLLADPQLAQQYANNAYAKARNDFRDEVTTQKTLELYKQLLAKRFPQDPSKTLCPLSDPCAHSRPS